MGALGSDQGRAQGIGRRCVAPAPPQHVVRQVLHPPAPERPTRVSQTAFRRPGERLAFDRTGYGSHRLGCRLRARDSGVAGLDVGSGADSPSRSSLVSRTASALQSQVRAHKCQVLRTRRPTGLDGPTLTCTAGAVKRQPAFVCDGGLGGGGTPHDERTRSRQQHRLQCVEAVQMASGICRAVLPSGDSLNAPRAGTDGNDAINGRSTSPPRALDRDS